MTTLFVDASALVAMIANEPDGPVLARRLARSNRPLCSAISLWETVMAVARRRGLATAAAEGSFNMFAAEFNLTLVPIDAEIAAGALAAHQRYGKGSGHPARLNMGDCFAYACAEAHGARLLYKGDDFARTDLAWAPA